jgi:hypothetical protein
MYDECSERDERHVDRRGPRNIDESEWTHRVGVRCNPPWNTEEMYDITEIGHTVLVHWSTRRLISYSHLSRIKSMTYIE